MIVCPLYNIQIGNLAEKHFIIVVNSSKRFDQFLSNIGFLINIKDCPPNFYIGEMPKNGEDGLYGILWRDELSQVFFHVNNLMQSSFPNPDKQKLNEDQLKDLACKKIFRHITNDNVAILWNESGKEIPEAFIKNNNIEIMIIITPQVTEFCAVKIINVLK